MIYFACVSIYFSLILERKLLWDLFYLGGSIVGIKKEKLDKHVEDPNSPRIMLGEKV